MQRAFLRPSAGRAATPQSLRQLTRPAGSGLRSFAVGSPSPSAVHPAARRRAPLAAVLTAAGVLSLAAFEVNPLKGVDLNTPQNSYQAYSKYCEPDELTREYLRLSKLGAASSKKGDTKQSLKYFSEAYELVKDVPSLAPHIEPASATMCGLLYAESGQIDEALRYFDAAMTKIQAVKPISVSCMLGVPVQAAMGFCYHAKGRSDIAEQMFENTIRQYEKCQGHYALSTPSALEVKALAGLDSSMLDSLRMYGVILASLDRKDQVAAVRQRMVQILRRSPGLRGKEATVMDQFDKDLAREKLRRKRLQDIIEGRVPFRVPRLF